VHGAVVRADPGVRVGGQLRREVLSEDEEPFPVAGGSQMAVDAPCSIVQMVLSCTLLSKRCPKKAPAYCGWVSSSGKR